MNCECRICGNTLNNDLYQAREMMFGLRDSFTYIQCSKCQCLQIKEIPCDLEKYYPDEYYSFKKQETSQQSPIKHFLKKKRTQSFLLDNGLLGKSLMKAYGRPELPDWFNLTNATAESSILDVGCGSGHLLCQLYTEGFSSLTGADPFIEEDIHYRNGVSIYKKTLPELHGQYDLIMLHHSFEHMPDPFDIFLQLSQKINNGGEILLRIPITPSYAWKKYRENWVQLDAPRHLFLHSIKSIEILSESAGLSIESINFDSTEFQIWGSEQYENNIPLHDDRSYWNNKETSIFTEDDMNNYRELAVRLNKSNEGDQAVFILKKKPPTNRL